MRRFHAYTHDVLVHGASFEGMVEGSMEHGVQVLEIRHDKLDSYRLHGAFRRDKKVSAFGRLLKLKRAVQVGPPSAVSPEGGASGAAAEVPGASTPSPMLQALQLSLKKKRDGVETMGAVAEGSAGDSAGSTAAAGAVSETVVQTITPTDTTSSRGSNGMQAE